VFFVLHVLLLFHCFEFFFFWQTFSSSRFPLSTQLQDVVLCLLRDFLSFFPRRLGFRLAVLKVFFSRDLGFGLWFLPGFSLSVVGAWSWLCF
jgi:hypothetical protein